MKNGDVLLIISDYLKREKDVSDKMNPTIRSKIIFGVVAIMKHAHKKGVILRDLKLNHILLDDNLEPAINPSSLSTFLTNPFDMEMGIGTPFFMTPEVFMNEDNSYDFSVDVYEYAFVLYKMFSNKIDFENKIIKSPQQYMILIGKGHRPKKQDNIPGHYWELIEKC